MWCKVPTVGTVAHDISPMLIRACTAHCSLEELDLLQCIFEGEGDALTESLRALSTAAPSVLTGVSLRGASLSSTMLHAMLEGVQSNTSLRSLTFSPSCRAHCGGDGYGAAVHFFAPCRMPHAGSDGGDCCACVIHPL